MSLFEENKQAREQAQAELEAERAKKKEPEEDELEEAGVVGPSDGSSKGREVLVDESYLERMAEDEYDSV